MNYDILLCVYLGIYFLVTSFISTRLIKSSSDHYFYHYYIDLIRNNRYRFLTFFPNIINKTPVCDPQLLHAGLSFLPKRLMGYATVFLNPIVTVLMFVAVYVGLKLSAEDVQTAFLVTILTSLVPQYYFLNNSRLAGLSSRGVGMMLFAMLGLVAMNATVDGYLQLTLVAIGALLVLLIVTSNIFAFQGLILISSVLLLFYGDISLFLMLFAGLIAFIIISRHYAFQYLSGLWSYWMLYKNIMANRFILTYRPSIYRDFYYDFIQKFRNNKAEFIRYAYSNSILILLFLSPVGIAIYFLIAYREGIAFFSVHTLFALKITIGSLVAFFLTSLKGFRFWGEPERYVELVIPFIIYFIVSLAFITGNESVLWYVAGYFLLINILQWLYFIIPLKIQRNRSQYGESQKVSLDEMVQYIDSSSSSGVILISNNQNVEKMLLNTKWKYIYYWPSIDNFDGYSFNECFEKFPFLNIDIMTKLAVRHDATHIVFDSSNGDMLPDRITRNFNNIFNTGSLSLWVRAMDQ